MDDTTSDDRRSHRSHDTGHRVSKDSHGRSHRSRDHRDHRDQRDHRDHRDHRGHRDHRHHRHHESDRISTSSGHRAHGSSRHHSNHGHSSRHRSLSKEPPTESQVPVEFTDEYGDWVIAKDTGYLYDKSAEVPENEKTTKEEDSAGRGPGSVDQIPSLDRLNHLRAQILKAEIQGDASLDTLKNEYDRLLGTTEPLTTQPRNDIQDQDNLHIIDPEMDKLSQIKASDNATVNEMVREEIASRIRGDGLDSQLANQISKDGGYEHDEDQLFDNAENLAKVSQKNESSLRNQVLNRTRVVNEAISNCSLCLDERNATTIVSMATRVYLCLAPSPAICRYTTVIVPMEHRKNTLECDDDEWEEIRNYMKSLTLMWRKENKAVLFYENAVSRSVKQHACIFAVPISIELLASAPGFFNEAFVTSDDEWASHRKVIDTRLKATQLDSQHSGTARYAFRTSIAKEAPYFHVWFDINGGMGHIVENTAKWPSGDLFGREVVGGMLQADPTLIRKKGQWLSNDPSGKWFQTRWSKYEWSPQMAQ